MKRRLEGGVEFSVRGQGPPVVFLHGIPTGQRLWDFVIEGMAASNTCIAVDLPGLGKSPPQPGPPDIDRMAEAVEELREDLGFPHWHVVGHDAGSTIAVHSAASYPGRVRRMVLTSPPVFPEFQRIWPFRLLQLPILGEALAPAVLFALWDAGVLGRGLKRPGTQEILRSFRHPFRGLAGSRRLLWLLRWGEPRVVLAKSASLLAQVQAPCLVIHGRQDRVVPPSFTPRAVEILPNARSAMLDAGHYLPLSVPEALVERIVPFLAAEVATEGGGLAQVSA